METKKCVKCGEVKIITDFHRAHGTYTNSCRICVRKKQADSRKAKLISSSEIEKNINKTADIIDNIADELIKKEKKQKVEQTPVAIPTGFKRILVYEY